MTVKEQLQAALDLLGPNGERWRKGHFAFDQYGDKVSANDPCARGWCSGGALIKTGAKNDAWDVLFGVKGGAAFSLVKFNDAPETTFADVKALFETAIAAA